MKFSKLFKISIISSALALTTNVFAKDGVIKVGVMSGPEQAVTEVAQQVAKDKYGLDVELVPFTDYVTPNTALENHLIDANAFQHKPYLDKQTKDRNWKDLVIVGKTFVFPIAAYSNKIKDLSQLKDGAIVALPNDPTNLGRALLLLQSKGLIKLRNPEGLIHTDLDIVENPKNLDIKTLDANLIARTLNQVDLAIINNTFAAQNGLSPAKDALFVEDKDSPYVNLIVAREDNKTDPDLINFIKAFNTEEVYQKALKEFDNSVVKGWE